MKATAVDKAKRLDIYCRMDGSFERTLIVKNASDGSDFDFTDFTVEFFVVDSWFKNPRLSLIDGDGLTVSTGSIEIEISAADLNIKKEDLYYFMWVTSPDGSKYVWLNGRFVVNHQLFDGVTSTDELTINNSPDTINIIISADGSGEATMPTFGSGVELDENTNTVRWGGTLARNTTILGADYNLTFGSTESRINRIIRYVTGQIQNFITAAGAWLTVVGTAQIVITEQATSIENDNVIGFKKQGDVVNTFEVTNLEDEATAPKATANEPLELANIDSQEELDRIITNNQLGKYREGALAYYNLPGRQPAIIYTFGGTLYSLNSYVDIGRYSQPSQYAPTSLQSMRTYEIQELLKSFDRLHVQFIVELEETAASEFGIRIWHDPIDTSPEFTDICLIETNSPGRYVIDVELAIGVVNVLEEDLWKQFCTAKIVGPSDENAAGYGTSVYPIQDFDTDGITAIQVVGKCSLINTLRVIHQDSYITRQQAEI